MILCRALSYEENTLDKSLLKILFMTVFKVLRNEDNVNTGATV